MISKVNVKRGTGIPTTKKYTKGYISMSYSPRDEKDLNRLLGMYKRYIDYAEGVFITKFRLNNIIEIVILRGSLHL